MKLNLRASLGSIYSALLLADDPTNIVRLLDFVEGWQRVRLMISKADHQTNLRFQFDTGMSVEGLIKKLVVGLPELFDCRHLRIAGSDGSFMAKNIRSILDYRSTLTGISLKQIDAISKHGLLIDLEDYDGPMVLARLSVASLVESMSTRVSVVAGLPPSERKAVSLEVLADRREVLLVNRLGSLVEKLRREGYAMVEIRPTMLCASGPKISGVIYTAPEGGILGQEWTFVADGHVVELPRQTDLGRLTTLMPHSLTRNGGGSKYVGSRVVAEFKDVAFSERFIIIPENSYTEQLDKIVEWFSMLLASVELQPVRDQARNFFLKSTAEKLTKRKNDVEREPRIFSGTRQVFRVPRSEQETIAVFAKLEAMEATPLHYINIIEMSPNGIDAIADVQVFGHEPVTKFALIEFEPRFSQFVTHRHPVDHVDLIVCWEVDGKWKERLEKTGHPWLFVYQVGDRRVRVISLSGFPGIRIQEG